MTVAPIGRRLNLRAPGAAYPPFICNVKNTVGEVTKTGNPEILDRDTGRWIPMNRYAPEGMRGRLPRNFFSTEYNSDADGSVLVRKATVNNQHDFLHKRCIRIPIERFRSRTSGSIIYTSGNPNVDCVSITSSAPTMLFELYWDTSRDLDLIVREPNGQEVSFRNPNSPSGGRHVVDAGAEGCGKVVVGREIISYSPSSSPQLGTYTVTMRHGRRCESVDEYNLSILVNGNVKSDEAGWLSTREKGLINLTTFELTADMLR